MVEDLTKIKDVLVNGMNLVSPIVSITANVTRINTVRFINNKTL